MAVTVAGITLGDPPSTTAVTVTGIVLSGPEPPRPTAAAVTVAGILLSGPVALAVEPHPDNPPDVGPGEQITLRALLSSTDTATWAWRRISGPATTLLADGATCHLTGPSTMPPSPQLLVLGVRATVGGQTSPETQITVRVLPQVSWTRTGAGLAGRRTAPA